MMYVILRGMCGMAVENQMIQDRGEGEAFKVWPLREIAHLNKSICYLKKTVLS